MDRATLSGLRELMQRHGLQAKKMYGQNFLVDKNTLHKIIALSGLSPQRYVVEIGPGVGTLSQAIAAVAPGVLAIEIDRSLKGVLNELAADGGNIKLLWGDILEVDIETELSRIFGPSAVNDYQICANIPYQITSPILFKLLQECPRLQSATLMIQREVAERMGAAPGTKDYGRLTVMVSYYAQVELLMKVSRHCFYPQPEVDSALIRLTPRMPRRFDEGKRLDRVVRAAFQQRRKTLLNALYAEWGGEKQALKERLIELGFEPQQRPETLSSEDFLRLASAWPN